jgi:hypothetical protein
MCRDPPRSSYESAQYFPHDGQVHREVLELRLSVDAPYPPRELCILMAGNLSRKMWLNCDYLQFCLLSKLCLQTTDGVQTISTSTPGQTVSVRVVTNNINIGLYNYHFNHDWMLVAAEI